jgi:hypothetical protein
MAIYTAGGIVGGGAPSGFTWSANYDDTTNDLTLQGDGQGWATVTVTRTTNGQQFTAAFLPPGQALPPGETATIIVPVDGGPTVIPNLPAKRVIGRGGSLALEISNFSWHLT